MMDKRPKQPDRAMVDELRAEIKEVQKFATDAQSEAGKNLIQILDLSIQNTIEEFARRDIEKFDTDTKLIFFCASCRSKLQTLMALRNKYVEAGAEKKRLSEELERIFAGGS